MIVRRFDRLTDFKRSSFKKKWHYSSAYLASKMVLAVKLLRKLHHL